MDSKLAQIYKTEENLQTEAEALATLTMAEKLASAGELDVDNMSDEDAEALARTVIGTEGEEEAPEANASAEEQEEGTSEPETEEPSADEESQEKVAEADHLGRVMAHAFVAERAKIAAAQATKIASAGGKVAKHLEAAGKAGKGKMPPMKKQAAKKEASAENELSALDQLAMARAQEILKENGIEPEQEKTANDMTEQQAAALQAKVEERAQAMLIEAGYTFTDATEAETQE